jgi:hypothetical protein
MSIVHIHTVIAIEVDTETGKVVGPAWDAGTDQMYDDVFIFEPERGEWAVEWDRPELVAAVDAAQARFAALIDSQGA